MKKFKVFLTIVLIICFYLLVSFKPNKPQTEVVFWTVQLSSFSSYIEKVITEFEKQYPHIKIKWVDIPYSEAEKRILASLLSNNIPDLVNITSDFNMTLASKGALAEFENGSQYYNSALIRTLTFDDKIWGVPFYATSAVTIFNNELINDFGIKSVPKTYDELFNQIEKAKMLPNKYLFMPTLTENDTFYKLLNKYGINSQEMLLSKKSQDIFIRLKNMYKNEKIPKEAITQTHREVLEKYSSGQIAYLQAGANFLNIIKENSLDIYNKTDITYQFIGEKNAYDFSLMTLAVPSRAKHREEAFLFAKYITNEKNQLAFSKLTGVLPCNKLALQDSYFQVYDNADLNSKARYIGVKQLMNPILYPYQTRKHKDIINILNDLVEQILLKDNNVKTQLKQAVENWNELVEN